jgi:hypothetical protein
MSASAPTVSQALAALIDALKASQDATFAEARGQYIDMRARAVPFPQELAAQLDAFFDCKT